MGDSIVDPASFEVAFTENFADVHRFLARRAGTGIADDLAAETFAVAYRRRATFDARRGNVRAWLFGIATRLLRAHRRDEQRLLALEARLARQAGTSTAAEETVLSARLAPALARALSRLGPEHRDVLLLHAWVGLSGEEIAHALGLPAGTVRSRLSRARAQLRDDLRDLGLDHALLGQRSEHLVKEHQT